MNGFRAGLLAGLRVERPKRKKPRQLSASELATIRRKLARERAVEAVY